MLHPVLAYELAQAHQDDLIKTAEAATLAQRALASRNRGGAELVRSRTAWWRTRVRDRHQRTETLKGKVEAGELPLDAFHSGAELNHGIAGSGRAGGRMLITPSTEETST